NDRPVRVCSGPADGFTSRLLALVFAEILEIGIDNLIVHVARASLVIGTLGVGLGGFIDRLAQLHRGVHQVLDTAADFAGVLGLEGLFQRANGQFDRLDGRAIHLVAVLLQRLLGRVDHAVGLLLGLDQFVALPVCLGVSVGVLDQTFAILVRAATRSLGGGLLHPPGAPVLGADAVDTVGVDVEGHLDLRHAARRP